VGADVEAIGEAVEPPVLARLAEVEDVADVEADLADHRAAALELLVAGDRRRLGEAHPRTQAHQGQCQQSRCEPAESSLPRHGDGAGQGAIVGAGT
jgi:hypothetical protein